MESFKGQLADSSVPNLLRVAVTANTEIFSFYESPADVIDDELGMMLLLSEFTNDKSLGLCHGIGKGNCFVRVAFLRDVLSHVSAPAIHDYATLVRHFKACGYTVKRVKFASSERDSRAQMERANARVAAIGCIVVAMIVGLLGYGAYRLFAWIF